MSKYPPDVSDVSSDADNSIDSQQISFEVLTGSIRTQALTYPEYDKDRTARVVVSLRANGAPATNIPVYLSVQVIGYMQPRIVALNDVALDAPVPTLVANTDEHGRLTVNVCLWRGPQQTSGDVRLFASRNEVYYSGDNNVKIHFAEPEEDI